MLPLILWLAAVALILAFFRACSIREALDQRADQQAYGEEGLGGIVNHFGGVQ